MSADDWDIDDDDWPDDDGETLTVPCPNCKSDIYEDAEQCPYCGEYVLSSTSAWSGRPVWWIVVGVLGILAVMFVFLAG